MTDRGVPGYCFDIDGYWWNGHGPDSKCPDCRRLEAPRPDTDGLIPLTGSERTAPVSGRAAPRTGLAHGPASDGSVTHGASAVSPPPVAWTDGEHRASDADRTTHAGTPRPAPRAGRGGSALLGRRGRSRTGDAVTGDRSFGL